MELDNSDMSTEIKDIAWLKIAEDDSYFNACAQRFAIAEFDNIYEMIADVLSKRGVKIIVIDISAYEDSYNKILIPIYNAGIAEYIVAYFSRAIFWRNPINGKISKIKFASSANELCRLLEAISNNAFSNSALTDNGISSDNNTLIKAANEKSENIKNENSRIRSKTEFPNAEDDARKITPVQSTTNTDIEKNKNQDNKLLTGNIRKDISKNLSDDNVRDKNFNDNDNDVNDKLISNKNISSKIIGEKNIGDKDICDKYINNNDIADTNIIDKDTIDKDITDTTKQIGNDKIYDKGFVAAELTNEELQALLGDDYLLDITSDENIEGDKEGGKK